MSVYHIDGNAAWSLSGGRTSARMVWGGVQAYGGALPGNHRVVFANTGKEREETLEFVHELDQRWGLNVVWVEWRAGATFEIVTFETASRNGEPLATIFDHYARLPNHLTRFCSTEAKRRTINRYLRSTGWRRWTDVIGLRFDEGARILKLLSRDPKAFSTRPVRLPLAADRQTKPDVMAFWSRQNFDLRLAPNEGNCTLCFEKGFANLVALIRANPNEPEWWTRQERRFGRQFERQWSYDQLMAAAMTPAVYLPEDEERDAECGLLCGSDTPVEKRALQREFERAFAAGELRL